MTTGYGINGIGYYPLGNLGLGSTGTYANYDYCMPSSMGMMGGMPGMYTMPGMMGMYNYMNPEYITQMNQRIETSHLNHASTMHDNVKDMEVSNMIKSTDAAAAKILDQGQLQTKIVDIKAKITAGDLEGAVQLHNELKKLTYNRIKDQLAERGMEASVQESLISYIDNLYKSINGTTLQEDIENCGETAWVNGFKGVFHKGHSKLTIQEALHEIYGRRIDNATSEKAEKIVGGVGGAAASFGQGAGYGAGLAGIAWLGTNLLSLAFTKKWRFGFKDLGNLTMKFAGGGAILNTVWKFI